MYSFIIVQVKGLKYMCIEHYGGMYNVYVTDFCYYRNCAYE